MITAVQKAPQVGLPEAVAFANELYGLKVTAQTLPSERDQNFLLLTPTGEKFVLKIANADEDLSFLELQNELIRLLANANLDLTFPRIVPSTSGQYITAMTGSDRQEHLVRLLTWVDGDCFARVQPQNRSLLASLGRALARMDATLVQFSHPAAQRSFYWDLRSAAMARELVPLLPAARQQTVQRFFNEWEQIDWSTLRCGVIHNDANDYNILVRSDAADGPRVAAIIDYGDVVHSAMVCDLAVALAYVMLDQEDPLRAAAQVIAAYQEVFPLTAAEIDVLYPLAATRLCLSVCIAAKQTRDAPQNEYLNISNAPAWSLLDQLQGISFDWARRVFRFAAGMPVVADVAVHRTTPELAAARSQRLGPSLSVSYAAPLHIVRGSRQFLFDAGGRRYLDCVNNVAHVGHSHPYVVRAAAEQMARLNTNTRYLHELLLQYSERLTATLPPALRVVYLVNSGSEANELALRLARAHTKKNAVMVVDCAYHGNTSAMIDISPYKFDGPGGRGCPSWVYQVAMPDVYRGEHRGADAGSKYAQAVSAAAQAAEPSGGVAAFFCESAVSCGGQIILPNGYLREAYAAVRAAGGVCVADEVQTGFGRAGTHFWMFANQAVVPDIVTLGKPMGNGHPLGAVITTAEIAASFANGMEYFNTFGGNPVSCAVGLAVLDVIEGEELQPNALEAGAYLQAGLKQLQAEHSLIGDVRGQGLFIGIELVRDRETREPADREASAAVERMKERGILLSTDGPFHNVIKIKPPLPFSRHDADVVIDNLNTVLKQAGCE
ncbi:MAG TPA: aminotransferase class III-fold pyridoxal phosphate-dependent enzyme [Pyrinomonadaceae bacterium]|nr:aminotransferase class III-fold pyridoxal phosphate-dependent enzyme [Pyrinomonadaceae bacterium]